MAAEEAPEYRSPKRSLALSFRLSRGRWKRKATERLAAIRCLRGRVRDLAVGRELWKRKALYYQDLLRQAGRLPAADLLPPDAFAGPPLPVEPAAPPPTPPAPALQTRPSLLPPARKKKCVPDAPDA